MATPFRFKNADNTTVDFEDYYVRADYFRSGNLWTWGYNFGQLGDNTTTNRSSPIQTVAGGSNWKSVASGGRHTAATKNDGTLWTWGNNANGQLGNNTTTATSSPVQTITFATNWKQVSCGTYHTAAIKTDGTLWTWGRNSAPQPSSLPSGQLGDNTATQRSSPVQTVAGGTNWKSLSSGFAHVAAIKTDGTLWTWGLNNFGQLGDNTIVKKSSPVQTVAFGTNWKQVSCGVYMTAAIKTDGTLWTWGRNYNGCLGDNTIAHKSSPVQTAAFGNNWRNLFLGGTDNIAAAIKNDGTLWTWGKNSSGALGDNTTVDKSSPIQTVTGGNNWKMFCSNSGSYAIKTDGTLWVWGNNNDGQLGDNTTISKSSPIQTILGGNNWKELAPSLANFEAAIQYQDDYQ